MDYVPGKRFVDCFEELNYDQKNKTATDLALIMSEIFSFTSSHCGSLLRDQSLASHQRSRRYSDLGPISTKESHSEVSDGSFLIGPVSDITFLEHKKIIPPAKCGPFGTERQFLEAFAYLGSPGTRPTDEYTRSAFEKLLEVYEVVRPEYPVSKGDLATFHFAHADLSVANVLLDPDTGAVTGIIDWEMAGFRPAWLAAAYPTWFDDDSCRFVMEDHQDSGPNGYGDETEDDAQLRQHFNTEMEARNRYLFLHNGQGVELRAIFYNLCNEFPGIVETWFEPYEMYHWDADTRPFPFDLMQWIKDRCCLWDE